MEKKKKEIVELEAKNAELINDLQRTRADFENFRKQTEMQTEMQKNRAKLATVYKILPLLDDVSRAIGTYAELAPLDKTLAKTMKDLGLEKIKSDEGTDFNPDIHDAVTMEDDGEGKEVVAETLREGYYYEGEVLRPAMVKVKTLKK